MAYKYIVYWTDNLNPPRYFRIPEEDFSVEDSPEPDVSPSPSPDLSPSPSLSPSPDLSPSPSLSPSPDAPTNFDVVVSGSVATCTWTAVSGVDGYNVYLKSNGEFVKQNSELVTETVYDIENLEDGNYEAYATSVLNSVESDASNVKGFLINLPLTETFLEANSIDQWVNLWGNGTWSRVSSGLAGVTDGFVLQQTTTANTRKDYSWWGAGYYQDVICEGRFRTNSGSSNQLRLQIRTGGEGGDEKLLSLELFNGVDVPAVFRFFGYGHTFGSGTSSVEYPWVANTWYNVEARIDGNRIRAMVWSDSESKPGDWMVDCTMSAVFEDYGFVGFGNFTGGTGVSQLFDLIKVLGTRPEGEFEELTLDSAGNSQSGNTFIIETGKLPVRIHGFSYSFQDDVVDDRVNVRYKEGDPTYNTGDYILHDTSGLVTGNGNELVDQRLDFATPLILEPNKKYTFFVCLDNDVDSQMNYTNGSQARYGSSLKYTSDRGTSTNTFDSTFADRQWNGRIHYDNNGI